MGLVSGNVSHSSARFLTAPHCVVVTATPHTHNDDDDGDDDTGGGGDDIGSLTCVVAGLQCCVSLHDDSIGYYMLCGCGDRQLSG
jgi:hypothetical protein